MPQWAAIAPPAVMMLTGIVLLAWGVTIFRYSREAPAETLATPTPQNKSARKKLEDWCHSHKILEVSSTDGIVAIAAMKNRKVKKCVENYERALIKEYNAAAVIYIVFGCIAILQSLLNILLSIYCRKPDSDEPNITKREKENLDLDTATIQKMISMLSHNFYDKSAVRLIMRSPGIKKLPSSRTSSRNSRKSSRHRSKDRASEQRSSKLQRSPKRRNDKTGPKTPKRKGSWRHQSNSASLRGEKSLQNQKLSTRTSHISKRSLSSKRRDFLMKQKSAKKNISFKRSASREKQRCNEKKKSSVKHGLSKKKASTDEKSKRISLKNKSASAKNDLSKTHQSTKNIKSSRSHSSLKGQKSAEPEMSSPRRGGGTLKTQKSAEEKMSLLHRSSGSLKSEKHLRKKLSILIRAYLKRQKYVKNRMSSEHSSPKKQKSVVNKLASKRGSLNKKISAKSGSPKIHKSEEEKMASQRSGSLKRPKSAENKLASKRHGSIKKQVGMHTTLSSEKRALLKIIKSELSLKPSPKGKSSLKDQTLKGEQSSHKKIKLSNRQSAPKKITERKRSSLKPSSKSKSSLKDQKLKEEQSSQSKMKLSKSQYAPKKQPSTKEISSEKKFENPKSSKIRKVSLPVKPRLPPTKQFDSMKRKKLSNKKRLPKKETSLRKRKRRRKKLPPREQKTTNHKKISRKKYKSLGDQLSSAIKKVSRMVESIEKKKKNIGKKQPPRRSVLKAHLKKSLAKYPTTKKQKLTPNKQKSREIVDSHRKQVEKLLNQEKPLARQIMERTLLKRKLLQKPPVGKRKPKYKERIPSSRKVRHIRGNADSKASFAIQAVSIVPVHSENTKVPLTRQRQEELLEKVFRDKRHNNVLNPYDAKNNPNFTRSYTSEPEITKYSLIKKTSSNETQYAELESAVPRITHGKADWNIPWQNESLKSRNQRQFESVYTEQKKPRMGSSMPWSAETQLTGKQGQLDQSFANRMQPRNVRSKHWHEHSMPPNAPSDFGESSWAKEYRQKPCPSHTTPFRVTNTSRIDEPHVCPHQIHSCSNSSWLTNSLPPSEPRSFQTSITSQTEPQPHVHAQPHASHWHENGVDPCYRSQTQNERSPNSYGSTIHSINTMGRSYTGTQCTGMWNKSDGENTSFGEPCKMSRNTTSQI